MGSCTAHVPVHLPLSYSPSYPSQDYTLLSRGCSEAEITDLRTHRLWREPLCCSNGFYSSPHTGAKSHRVTTGVSYFYYSKRWACVLLVTCYCASRCWKMINVSAGVCCQLLIQVHWLAVNQLGELTSLAVVLSQPSSLLRGLHGRHLRLCWIWVRLKLFQS